MTAVETLTKLMDKARSLTGLTDKISVPRLTGLMDHFDLHVNPNLLSKTTLTSPAGGLWGNVTTGVLKPGTYTFSWCAKTTGDSHFVRLRPFDVATNKALSKLFRGDYFPITDSKQSYTFSVPDDGRNYTLVLYGNKGADGEESNSQAVIFYDCKLEVGDLATPLEKVGGGVAKAFLTALTPIRGCAA